jgi:hypothetical protein
MDMAATVETLEEMEVLEKGVAGGDGSSRRRPRGWKTMPFIIGTRAYCAHS